MRVGLFIGVTLSALAAVSAFGSLSVVADPESASLLIADNGKPRRLTTKSASPPVAVQPAGTAAGADANAVRAILDMPNLAWQDLSPVEATALQKLDWSKRSWNERTAPSAPWPQSMTTKYLNLTAVQKASVRKLGYRPLEWDLRVRKRMLSSQ